MRAEMNDNLSPDQFAAYTSHYNKGWRHSSTARSPSLEVGDRYAQKNGMDAGKAWEDGYMDHAVGRDKYALRGHRFNGDSIEGY